MDPDILEKFDALFADIDNMNPQKIEQLVHETLKFFEYLQTQLKSSDENVRKEGLEMAQKLQKRLEEFSKKALEKSGLTPDQLQQFISSPSNFSKEQWESFEHSQQEINQYQQALKPAKKPTLKKPKNSTRI